MTHLYLQGMHELPLVGKRTNYAHQHIPPNNLTHPQKVHAFAKVAWEFLKPLYKADGDRVHAHRPAERLEGATGLDDRSGIIDVVGSEDGSGETASTTMQSHPPIEDL